VTTVVYTCPKGHRVEIPDPNPRAKLVYCEGCKDVFRKPKKKRKRNANRR